MTTELIRCPWLDMSKEHYVTYHDTEWGVASHDDAYLFELLILELLHTGLSFQLMLLKRENLRLAFDNFNPQLISQYDDCKIEQLMNNEGIIRYRPKIEAIINNSQKFLLIQKEFGSFANYLWQFVDNKTIVHNFKELKDYSKFSKESDIISHDLRKRGFTFLGTTTIYSYMQAIGMLNDHSIDCFRHSACLNDAQ